MIDLSGRRILVTGGSRGIGRAVVLMAARAGADVGILYHTGRADADEVSRAVRALGRRAFVGGGDLGEPGRVVQLMSELRAAFGGIDGLVINHGIWPIVDTPIEQMATERWRTTMRTNLDSVFEVTRAGLGMMSDGGTLVIVTSTAAQRGEPGHADYAASKGALTALVKSLAVECAPGITVNAVAPGWVDTEMSADAYADGGRERIAASIPIGRIAAADDVAGPIVFLLSKLARHVTGATINVNGGAVLT